jgi:hypothetical protein
MSDTDSLQVQKSLFPECKVDQSQLPDVAGTLPVTRIPVVEGGDFDDDKLPCAEAADDSF